MISVIVPIYNVEPYLKKCLDSLAAQTFHDVEFILVDDGSTDRSGQIADEYLDSRFKVFHTENRGLSAARNYGIDNSDGEWIMFLDGDDFVSPEFCEIPYRHAILNNADIVIFRAYNVKKQTIKKTSKKNWPNGIQNAETAVDCGRNVVWNKLYNRRLFDAIRFPSGRAAEDTATTYKLIYEANRIVFIENYLYYYIIRGNSLSHSKIKNSYVDVFLFAYERFENLIKLGYPYDKAKTMLISKAVSLIAIPDLYGTDVYHKAETLLDGLPAIPDDLPKKKRIALFVWRKNKKLFRYTCNIFFKNTCS